MSPDRPDVGIADIIDACDLLTERLEQYLEQLEAEHDPAVARGDHRHIMRVERGIGWTEQLLDAMDDLLERVGSLRHNDQQLRWAREGKMV